MRPGHRITGVLVVLLALAGLAPRGAVAQGVSIPGPAGEVLVNLRGGLPARWLACVPDCTAAREGRLLLRAGDGGSELAWEIPGDAAATAALAALPYTRETRAGAAGTDLILTSVGPWDGIQLIHRYRLAADGRVLAVSLQVPAGARLVVRAGTDLVPPPLPGLGAMYARTRALRLDAGGQHDLAPGESAAVAADWAGVRGRFWTVLASADEPLTLTTGDVDGRPWVAFARPGGAAGPMALRFYAGPVERSALAAADPRLRGLLYAAIWEPLRWLAFGLQYLLEAWQAVVGSWALAIILLSATVKLLMAPLTWVAGRLQDQVNRTQSLLAPELAAIRRDFRGEEAHRRTLAVYARHGVSPWYTLKSLLGFLIQIPVFIAAFDMLGEQFGLAGARFLWAPDLSLPDRALAFAAPVPFFGGHLNLLPLVMTTLTLLASRLQEDPGLTPDLRAGQRRRLYAMAALFFVLLYTFPAGMVLYWTTNNALHLAGVVAGRLRRRA